MISYFHATARFSDRRENIVQRESQMLVSVCIFHYLLHFFANDEENQLLSVTQQRMIMISVYPRKQLSGKNLITDSSVWLFAY